ncbi:hypothetical protein [Caulobacter hibisci]|uniref:Uncharacterized protein n=1 Tax=Caulobacter hibisci TaxID=2035993 RepID=A0ABS0SUJ4_9CAUL|nr:hypothetical protein [Caulobacter hibisci]MBI1682605.1 hypothetical protein [Caulobacter hibisci]
MAQNAGERPSNHEVEHENQRANPATDGKPPRPATEPAGGEDSVDTAKTRADPGSGEN